MRRARTRYYSPAPPPATTKVPRLKRTTSSMMATKAARTIRVPDRGRIIIAYFGQREKIRTLTHYTTGSNENWWN